MHPVISDLVSRCFYERDLEPHPDCVDRYLTEKRPFSTIDSDRLPMTPILVVDMPYVQKAIGQQQHGDRLPRWHNPEELKTIIELLSLIRPERVSKKAPTLAVLSPYMRQVFRLGNAIDEHSSSKLAHLDGFHRWSKFGGFCGTVDSFQGSEADIVFVSFVRNNQHSNVHNALGFLSDFRRMNVMLSRARWQLVLVGSLDFIDSIVQATKAPEERKKINFLCEMLQELREGNKAKRVTIIEH
jgi:superfamily I DNA and/or RNA helicase